MSIASLINVPKTFQEWQSWSFTHKIQHDAINRAVLAKKSKTLIERILDPINKEVPDVFLQNNSQLHLDICALLGIEGSDLLSVDWQDEKQLGNWIYLHWQEHSNFNAALGI